MKLGGECILCLIDKNWERVKDYPMPVRDEYMTGLLKIMSNAGDRSATGLGLEVRDLRKRVLNMEPDDYTEKKREFNDLVLGRIDELRKRIDESADPLREAIRLAMAGNYIDYSSVSDVNPEKLFELLDTVDPKDVHDDEYETFSWELSAGRRIAYITDNCGEVVLDRLVIENILKKHPNIQEVTVIVRGGPVANDATVEDAKYVGLDSVAKVISTGVAIGGTELSMISREAMDALDNADLILSKGQGNFETLSDCGRNIYYMFLCKCPFFTKKFGLERFRGVFANEKRLADRVAE